MTACKWDAEAKDYLTDDGPCRHDDYGDPTRHCTARRTCSQHVGWGELTCARCLGRVRQDIRAIVDLAALMPFEALTAGIQSEAAMLAGPAADVEAWSWRKIAAKQGGSWHLSLIEEDDDWHPETVLTRWQWMVAEDEKDDRVYTLTEAAAYLDRKLGKVAQDEGQDFPLLRREVRKCREHLEAVLHNGNRAERGAPCPACVEQGKPADRLQRRYGHWCEDEGCERLHYLDDSADEWVCPRDRSHVWKHEAYANWIEERTGGRSA